MGVSRCRVVGSLFLVAGWMATPSRAATAVPPPTTAPAAYVRPPPQALALPTAPGEYKLKFATRIGRRAVTMSYLLQLPADYAHARRRPPVLAFFHGIGESGTDLGGIYAIGPMTVFRAAGSANPALGATSPFIMVCPQCPPRGERWDDDFIYRTVDELLDSVVHSLRADADRVYATGLSAGGQETWCAAEAAPDLFAAVAPLSAMPWQVDSVADRLRFVPVWTLTGLDDAARFVDGNRAMERALARVPVPDRFTYYQHEGHWIFASAFASPQFYEWMLGHRRPTAAAHERLRAHPPASQPAMPTAPGHYVLTFDTKIGEQPYPLDYVLYLPRPSAGTGRARRPAMLFLHEHDTIGPAFNDVCVHGPDLALERHPDLRSRWPFVVIAPRLPIKFDWDSPGMSAALAGLLDHVTAALHLDPDRTVVAGLDHGAVGAWRLADALPDRFAAVAWISTRPDLEPPGDNGRRLLQALPGRAFVTSANGGLIDRLTGEFRGLKRDWQAVPMPGTAAPLDDLPVFSNATFVTWLSRQHREPRMP